jgi:hypothetical protein
MPTIPVARWLTPNGKGNVDLKTHLVRTRNTLRRLGLKTVGMSTDGDTAFAELTVVEFDAISVWENYDCRQPLHRQAHIDSVLGDEWMFPDPSHTGKTGRYTSMKEGKNHVWVGELNGLKRGAYFTVDTLIEHGFAPWVLRDDSGSKQDDTLTEKCFSVEGLGMIRAQADQFQAMLDAEINKCRAEREDVVSTHDVPAAFSVLACQHCFAEASKTEVREAKSTIVNYLALQLYKAISPQLEQHAFEWVTGLDDGPEPDLGPPDDVSEFLWALRSMFRLEDKLLEARAAYWGLLPLVCLEEIVNCQDLKQSSAAS